MLQPGKNTRWTIYAKIYTWSVDVKELKEKCPDAVVFAVKLPPWNRFQNQILTLKNLPAFPLKNLHHLKNPLKLNLFLFTKLFGCYYFANEMAYLTAFNESIYQQDYLLSIEIIYNVFPFKNVNYFFPYTYYTSKFVYVIWWYCQLPLKLLVRFSWK